MNLSKWSGRTFKRTESYQICVTIIEAKHLPPNCNPFVVVKIGDLRKKTAVRKHTDNPFYNEVIENRELITV